MIDYSIIIRTTGKAGEKYSRLLDSITKLIPQPKEIIVVLPEGYAPPKETLGREKILYCSKGMVTQRLCGMHHCTTHYALVTDDDIAFQPDFVVKLYNSIYNSNYGFSVGPLPEFLPKSGIQSICSSLIGAAVPTLLHKNLYNTVLKTTGYSFNRHIMNGNRRYMETQSAPWTCFFADMKAIRAIHFEDELWLDMHGYSAFDDTAMFYKAWLCGWKTVVVLNAFYEHLDAGTSRKNNNEQVEYSNGFNMVVFWHRFLYSQETGIKKKWCRICLEYRIMAQKCYNNLNRLRGKMNKVECKAFETGVSKGREWVNSEAYAEIPPLKY